MIYYLSIIIAIITFIGKQRVWMDRAERDK